ncbi:hypothetical protein BEH94_05175 [Candidatus Altiarchaeales archaeon WOR_SM1_SCG]|nr:hypothetical protein BEH94_05175 [Candidatus Altiarchaeales archaeon WOR_SM1_SCG]
MDIELEFISSDALKEKIGTENKVNYILDRVRGNKILILEESLSYEERKKLMEADMAQIDDEFTGIEFDTLGGDEIVKTWTEKLKKNLIKILGGKTGGLTVIGPSKLIREIKKHPQKISLLAGIKEE